MYKCVGGRVRAGMTFWPPFGEGGRQRSRVLAWVPAGLAAARPGPQHSKQWGSTALNTTLAAALPPPHTTTTIPHARTRFPSLWR